MINVIKFLLFISYSTIIFFLPNNKWILIIITINIFLMLIAKVHLKNAIKSIIKFLPFILFTFIINCLLDNVENSLWIGIKLIIVCNITFIYSKTTTITRNSKNHKINMYTIKNI